MYRLLSKLTPIFLALVGVVSCVPWEPEPRNDPNWLAQHESYVRTTTNSNGTIQAIFMGASITDWWPEDLFLRHFAAFGAVNYGISGDGVEHAFWRMMNGEVEGLENSLKLIVFADCGSNSAGSYNAEDIARGYNATLTWIRQRLPNTRVLLMGLMPRDNGNADRWIRLADVNIRNSKWEDTANTSSSQVRYLDLWGHFSREWGIVEENLFLDDQLHLTHEGYVKWVEIINPLFREMMGI